MDRVGTISRYEALDKGAASLWPVESMPGRGKGGRNNWKEKSVGS